MDIKQLNTLVTLHECGFNVTETAEKLFVVQSAVSQQLSRLEKELGTRLFVRAGKRLVGLTEAGQMVLDYAHDALIIRDNILAVGEDKEGEVTALRLGATHAQARYVLPAVIKEFRQRYPDSTFQIMQGTPSELVEMAVTDKVDMAICTEQLGQYPLLKAFSCYRWNRRLVAPEGHPVFSSKPMSLESICKYPLITYTYGFTGAEHIDSILNRAGLSPQIVLTAVDTDVIKTYVREELGVGIIAGMAWSGEDEGLQSFDLSGLLPWETTWVAYHRDKFLKSYQVHFLELITSMVLDNGVIRTA